jgi:hypothetical protein
MTQKTNSLWGGQSGMVQYVMRCWEFGFEEWCLKDSIVSDGLPRLLLHLCEWRHFDNSQASAFDKSTISTNDFCQTRVMHINENQRYNNDNLAWLISYERVHIPCLYLV